MGVGLEGQCTRLREYAAGQNTARPQPEERVMSGGGLYGCAPVVGPVDQVDRFQQGQGG